LLALLIALLISKIYNSSLVTLLWTFVSTSLIIVTVDGGFFSDGYISVLALFIIFIFLFLFVGKSFHILSSVFVIFFLPLLHFLRDLIVQLSYLFPYSQLTVTDVRRYELLSYYVFLCLMVLVFVYYNRESILRIKFDFLFREKGTMNSIQIKADFLRWVVIILIIIIAFNLLKLSFVGVGEFGTNKVSFLSSYELNSTLDNLNLTLLYSDQKAHIYTLESKNNLKRSDLSEIKNRLDSSFTKSRLKTLEFCYGKPKRYYMEIYNSPELEVNQIVGPIKIIDIQKLTQNITKITYDCECAACYFAYNLAIRNASGHKHLISLIYLRKKGIRPLGYYLDLFFPFDF